MCSSDLIPEKTEGKFHSGIKRRYIRNIPLSGGLPTEYIPHYNGAVWMPENNRWKYVFPDNKFMKDGIHSIDGSDYCFDKDGYLLKGWISLGNNRYYEALHPKVSRFIIREKTSVNRLKI